MNVYDFDNTIYDGESIFDFYLFSARKQPRLLKYLFVVVKTLFRYKFSSIPTTELEEIAKKYAESYLGELKEKDRLVKEFWNKNAHKLKPFYFENRKEDDVILSASVDFLLKEILERFGGARLLSSSVDVKTGKVLRICYRKNKAALFQKEYPNTKIEHFYTDSFSDAEMFSLSEHVHLVKKNNIREISDIEKEEIIQKYSEKNRR